MSQPLVYLQQTRLLFTLAQASQKITIIYIHPISCKAQKVYCMFFNAHVQNCLISTSGLKPDVIIVFFDPLWYLREEEISI